MCFTYEAMQDLFLRLILYLTQKEIGVYLNMSSTVSIIVPVFNAQKSIDRCLKSILNQRYENIEVIIVNDGSTDSSVEKCNYYAKTDRRVIVKHKSNEGPSAARRDGVVSASGKYVCFVDADDFIHKDMLLKLVSKIKDGYDIVQCGYRSINSYGTQSTIYRPSEISMVNTAECSLHYASKRSTNFLWDKIYRRKLFDDITFPKLSYGEDYCILSQLFFYARNFATIETPLYNYVTNENSLTQAPFSLKKLDNIEAGKFVFQFYSRKNPNLLPFAALHICWYTINIYKEVNYSNHNSKTSIINEMKLIFKEYRKYIKIREIKKHSSYKKLAVLLLFQTSPKLYILFRGKRP